MHKLAAVLAALACVSVSSAVLSTSSRLCGYHQVKYMEKMAQESGARCILSGLRSKIVADLPLQALSFQKSNGFNRYNLKRLNKRPRVI
jgi:hypothetical protein